MTRGEFRVLFSEFNGVGDLTIDAYLAQALLRLSPKMYGNRIDEAQGYLTAHKLALSPAGQAARLAPAQGDTTYWTHFKQIMREVTIGMRETGEVAATGLTSVPGVAIFPFLS